MSYNFGSPLAVFGEHGIWFMHGSAVMSNQNRFWGHTMEKPCILKVEELLDLKNSLSLSRDIPLAIHGLTLRVQFFRFGLTLRLSGSAIGTAGLSSLPG